MARSPRDPTPQPSDTVRVARISALQGVLVALIAGFAGVVGTAGLKYWERSTELTQAKQAVTEAEAKAEQQVAEVKRSLERLQRQAPPSTILLTGQARISPVECFERLQKSIDKHVPNAGGTSFEGRARQGVGSVVQRGLYEARVLCRPESNLVVLAVAGIRQTPSAEVESLATKLLEGIVSNP
jgi:hypothetical protein